MQVLVDISVIARHDAHTGIQRVVRGILRQMLLFPPSASLVVPVRAGRWLGYRYAGNYAHRLTGRRDYPSGKVKTSPGDIFLGLDLAPKAVRRHHAQLRQWKSSGVGLWFFLHDLLPLSH